MYKEFFNLNETPFDLTPDPRFLYMSDRHREALAALVYGIKESKGFIVLTGEIGSGKTTLCRAFLRELHGDSTHVALILNSFLDDVELLQAINDELEIDSSSTSKKKLIDALNQFLLAENAKGKTTILIIDEAQNLGTPVLEQIRMLSNLETESSKLIQIALVGQPELNEILKLPSLEQLNQRITVRYHIAALSKSEIHNYIHHRLHVAGAKISIPFTTQAINRIFHFSGGIPRKINLLCDRALLTAYVGGQFQIDANILAKSEREVGILDARPPRVERLRRTLAQPIVVVCVTLTLLMGVGWTAREFGWLSQRDQTALDDPYKNRKSNNNNDGQKPRVTPTPTPISRITFLEELESLPQPTAFDPERQWAYDKDGVLRADDLDFSRHASLFTLAALWRRPFEVEEMRDYKKSDILSLNILSILDSPELSMRSFRSDLPLRELIRMDLPLLIELEENSRGPLAPNVTLTHYDGEKCRVGDPRLGKVEISLRTLERLTGAATAIYYDPDNLAGLTPGVKDSDAVERLRIFLTNQGFWKGESPTRSFDAEMIDAIILFQQANDLPGLGSIDGRTAALIASRQQGFRPRLAWTSAPE